MENQTMNTSLITSDEKPDFVADLQTASVAFCSFNAHSPEEQKSLYKAMNNPDKKLSDMINLEIAVKDIYCENINIVNKDTGETVPSVRMVLIDENGVSYQCVSNGVFNSIRKAIAVFGLPTWDEPLHFVVKKINVQGGQGWSTMTLNMV